MPPIKRTGPYSPTHEVSPHVDGNAKGDGWTHKEIMVVVRQLGRPLFIVPRGLKKPGLVDLWRAQDRLILEIGRRRGMPDEARDAQNTAEIQAAIGVNPQWVELPEEEDESNSNENGKKSNIATISTLKNAALGISLAVKTLSTAKSSSKKRQITEETKIHPAKRLKAPSLNIVEDVSNALTDSESGEQDHNVSTSGIRIAGRIRHIVSVPYVMQTQASRMIATQQTSKVTNKHARNVTISQPSGSVTSTPKTPTTEQTQKNIAEDSLNSTRSPSPADMSEISSPSTDAEEPDTLSSSVSSEETDNSSLSNDSEEPVFHHHAPRFHVGDSLRFKNGCLFDRKINRKKPNLGPGLYSNPKVAAAYPIVNKIIYCGYRPTDEEVRTWDPRFLNSAERKLLHQRKIEMEYEQAAREGRIISPPRKKKEWCYEEIASQNNW